MSTTTAEACPYGTVVEWPSPPETIMGESNARPLLEGPRGRGRTTRAVIRACWRGHAAVRFILADGSTEKRSTTIVPGQPCTVVA